MSVVGTLVKQPYEEIVVSVDFSEVLASGEEIASASVLVTERGSGSDVTSAMAGTPIVLSPLVSCLIKSGEHGTQYYASFRVVTDGDVPQKFEADVLVKVVAVE